MLAVVGVAGAAALPAAANFSGQHSSGDPLTVNLRATDSKGDSFNDPIHWIAALTRDDGRWQSTS